MLNGLRGRIAVQVDGGIRTGRDVAVGAPARRRRVRFLNRASDRGRLHHDAQMPPQHLPGRAWRRKTRMLRKQLQRQPEHVINYFFFVAEELREIMAEARTSAPFNEMIGRVDQMLDQRTRAGALEAEWRRPSRLFTEASAGCRERHAHLQCEPQDHRSREALDRKLIAGSQSRRSTAARRCAASRHPQRATAPSARMLSGEVAQALRPCRPARRHDLACSSPAPRAQSFGALLARGITFELDGDANDYVGKGLSRRPHRGHPAAGR